MIDAMTKERLEIIENQAEAIKRLSKRNAALLADERTLEKNVEELKKLIAIKDSIIQKQVIMLAENAK